MPRKAKAQRTDLNATQVTVPGQDYGKQVEQQRAMQSVPMANAFQQSAVLQKAAASADVQASPATQVQEPPDFSSLKFLHPTEQPNVPMTHGLPVGPGAGPEAMGAYQSPQAAMADRMAALARGPYSTPQIVALADAMQQSGL